jgi:hypothetical protein
MQLKLGGATGVHTHLIVPQPLGLSSSPPRLACRDGFTYRSPTVAGRSYPSGSVASLEGLDESATAGNASSYSESAVTDGEARSSSYGGGSLLGEDLTPTDVASVGPPFRNYGYGYGYGVPPASPPTRARDHRAYTAEMDEGYFYGNVGASGSSSIQTYPHGPH